MSKSSERVKKWRKTMKSKMVQSMGGCCQCCGYNKCHGALEFHHLDPKEKDFSFGDVITNPTNIINIINELKKCILLCSNCHREIHNGITDLPKNYKKVDVKVFINIKEKLYHPCSICGNPTYIKNKTCSTKCKYMCIGKIDWNNVDLLSLLKSGLSYSKISDMLGCSDSAVRKRAIKLGIEHFRKGKFN